MCRRTAKLKSFGPGTSSSKSLLGNALCNAGIDAAVSQQNAVHVQCLTLYFSAVLRVRMFSIAGQGAKAVTPALLMWQGRTTFGDNRARLLPSYSSSSVNLLSVRSEATLLLLTYGFYQINNEHNSCMQVSLSNIHRLCCCVR